MKEFKITKRAGAVKLNQLYMHSNKTAGEPNALWKSFDVYIMSVVLKSIYLALAVTPATYSSLKEARLFHAQSAGPRDGYILHSITFLHP